jgi:hypothetical protein
MALDSARVRRPGAGVLSREVFLIGYFVRVTNGGKKDLTPEMILCFLYLGQ